PFSASLGAAMSQYSTSSQDSHKNSTIIKINTSQEAPAAGALGANYALAVARLEARLCTLPHVPGLKQPGFFLADGSGVQTIKWTPYQTHLPTEHELQQWYQNPLTGHSVLAGPISGGHDAAGQPLRLEILDLDDPALAAHILAQGDLQAIL